jgi:hypothetical protein
MIALILSALSSMPNCSGTIMPDQREGLSGQSHCQEWDHWIAGLSSAEQAALKRDGAIFTGEHFIVGADLIGECGLRVNLSKYLLGVLTSDSKESEAAREFAARHSKEIVAVLRRIWPSLSDSQALDKDGGLADLKYLLLAEPGIDEKVLSPLINDILVAETIDNNLARIIFQRPMAGVIPALLHLQEDAEAVNDISWQILNLALLQRLGEPSALPKLRNMLQHQQLTKVEKRYIKTLISKAEAGEEIKFSDIENLEYEN